MKRDVELYTTAERIAEWRSLAPYEEPRAPIERILDCALYVLWALALIVGVAVFFFRR